MTLASLMKDYGSYNLWANQLMVQWFVKQPESKLTVPIESSFPSIRSTILHICDAEYVWHRRLRNEEIQEVPSKYFKGDMYELFELLISSSINFNDLINNLKDEDFVSMRTYKNFTGPETTSVAGMVHHCMNHGSYHRGQLITMGRQLNFENPPKTDFIQFLREKNY